MPQFFLCKSRNFSTILVIFPQSPQFSHKSHNFPAIFVNFHNFCNFAANPVNFPKFSSFFFRNSEIFCKIAVICNFLNFCAKSQQLRLFAKNGVKRVPKWRLLGAYCEICPPVCWLGVKNSKSFQAKTDRNFPQLFPQFSAIFRNFPQFSKVSADRNFYPPPEQGAPGRSIRGGISPITNHPLTTTFSNRQIP